MPEVTRKRRERLEEMLAGYCYAIEHKLWVGMSSEDLRVMAGLYLSMKGIYEYRARGIAMALRETIRMREQNEVA